MTDHANELRRYSRKIGHPAGDVPSVMLAAADEIERLRAENAGLVDDMTLLRDHNTALRARIEKMEKQEPIGTTGGMPGTTGFTMACFHADKVPIGSKLYALPGAQNVPKEAIAKILTEVTDIAVSNGANSISMPDEYVEVAAWLCGMPTQNVPMPPCGPRKDYSELDDGADTMLPRFGPAPTPNTPHNTNQVPEPGTLTLIGVGAALMMRKAKRTTRQGEGK